MPEVRSYITAKEAAIEVTVEDLNNLCNEFNLQYISLNEYEPTYMSSEELNITDIDYKTKTYKLPKKKPVTIEWIVEKINSMQKTEKAYIDLAKKVKKITDKFGNQFNIYPASYGIGIHTVFSAMDEEFKEITNLLDSYKVEYRLEWSKAFWVKRIIISKSKENLDKILLIK